MSFFRNSFENLGETLKTLSLVIGLLITSATGVGYVYSMLSDQKAMATEISSQSARISTLEKNQINYEIDRHRIQMTEEGVKAINTKFDRFLEMMAVEGNKKRR
jgi:AAA15 family ATPase/GTPase